MEWVVLCRYGEIFLKSGNRKRFEEILRRNAAAAVADVPGATVAAPHGRIVVSVPDEATADDAAVRLARVFGLVSLSVACVVPASPEDIGAAAVARATRAQEGAGPRSFKIEARRTDKQFPLSSMEVAREVGARVAAATGLPVDVHRPDLVVGIEITTSRAFVYAGTHAAPGGLPVG